MKPDPVFDALGSFIQKGLPVVRGMAYDTIKGMVKKPSAAAEEKDKADRRLAILKK